MLSVFLKEIAVREKINESEIEEISRLSRTGKYGTSEKDISAALETEGQPFEVYGMP